MKKITSLLLIFLTACGIEYEGETKLVIKGKIVDSNNNPLVNKEVKLFVYREGQPGIGFSSPSEENFIGKALTNSIGEYTMVIPKPKNDFDEIIVETNPENNTLNPKQYRNIKTTDFLNYQLILPNSKLYLISELTTMNLGFNSTSGGFNDLIDVKFTGEFSNFIEYYNPITDTIANFYNLNVKRNQNFIVTYKIKNRNTNQITEFNEIIVIDNSNIINYTINY